MGMQEIKFALSANAGLAITFPTALIWIDAIHIKKAPIYSTVTPEIWEHMLHDPDYVGASFSGPDAIAATHCHIDHFTSEITREARSLWPSAKIVLPEKYFDDQVYISSSGMYVDINGVTIHYIKTRHSTKHFHDKNHYSLLINAGGTRIFMPADASLTDPVMHYYALNTDIDIAIVDFTWLLLGKGRSLIENDIRPKHLLVYHLPFEADDPSNYRMQVRESAPLLKSPEDVRIFSEPFQKEIIRI